MTSCLLVPLGPVLAAAEGPSSVQVTAKAKSVTKNDAIDYKDEEEVLSQNARVLGHNQLLIRTTTFTPPSGMKFVSFGTTFVDVQADPTLMTIDRIKDSPTEIQVRGIFYNMTAVKWPLRCEGNLGAEGQPGGEPPHWSTKQGALQIVLTFDDGPHAAGMKANRTAVVLDTLINNQTQPLHTGAFFIQSHSRKGKNFFHGNTKNGDAMVLRESTEKHIVAIHTGSYLDHDLHTNRVQVPPDDVDGDGLPDGKNGLESDIIRCKAYIKKITGEDTKYIRPPTGAINKDVRASYALHNVKNILWDIDSGDSQGLKPDAVKKQLAKQLTAEIKKNNTEVVVLFHDINGDTAKNLADYMDVLDKTAKANGVLLAFTTARNQVDAMFAKRKD